MIKSRSKGAQLCGITCGPSHFDIEQILVFVFLLDSGDDPVEGFIANAAEDLIAYFAVKTLCFTHAALFDDDSA